MRTRFEPGPERPGLRLGFTLIELLVVMTIIGIIIVFLLVAAGDARRRAEEDATLALITKLEGGVNDRLDALLQTRPDPNAAHYYMAGIYPAGSTIPISQASNRAQVFAWYDYIKSELPDVFFVQNTTGPYPLNFAANPYPGTPIDSNGFSLGNYMLPLGNGVVGGQPLQYGANNLSQPMGTGIYGASYSAAAGIYKNLGYLPAGYDGIDNDGNGYIDDWNEGINVPPSYTTPNTAVLATVQGNLAAHQQNTARSETLYAILVSGVGPLGSVFSPDDFSDREVQDTDHDGLPEFVDAWGQPLQFFRWPLLYHSETQKGQVIDFWDYTKTPPASSALELFNPPYRSVFEAREQDPLDPNQQLMAPAWWTSLANPSSPFVGIGGTTASLGESGGVQAFQYFFHRLTEPYQNTGNPQFFWDRASPVFPQNSLGLGYRRAFLSKPLIVSSGPDQQLGIFQLSPSLVFPTPPLPLNAANLIFYENNAIQFDPTLFGSGETVPAGSTTLVPPTSAQLRDNGRDNISNQNRQATGGPGGS
ncbi:MAG TPA: prepilin-type N-terminal cleavage/methylation domain-containing protein [Isosphaeraceae bacterium]|nr:prepilin-type N-terminal cleavage/methylation domain-containing protein [Isosphaeraceae bacterium]